MKKSNCPVLIVGAGPTGLMMACQLSRFGVDFRIIDKKEGTTQLSKALGVQARTLEIYEQLGIVEEALAQGVPAESMQVMVNGKLAQEIPLSAMGEGLTAYPYMFVLEQSKNEDLLYAYLKKNGHEVEWNCEMLEFMQEEDNATVLIQDKNGEQEEITANWVIAADGGRSPLRHALQMQFKGDTYENIFYVVDTDIEWEFKEKKLYSNLAHSSFAAFFPMKDDNRYRVVGILPEEFENEADVSFDDIKEVIKEKHKIKLEFGKTHWFSVYKVHHRCIDNFRNGRVFFAGDAAHVHSPAGGQGMNTGLQDAYNLAWKLAWVLQEKAPLSVLDTYNEERLPVAHRLVNTTDRGFSTMVKKGTLANFFRLKFLPMILGTALGFDAVRKRAFRVVSQIGIRYRKSSLSKQTIALVGKLKAGDRMPYVQVYDEQEKVSKSIYQYMKTTKCQALIWLSNKDEIGEKEADALKECLGNYADQISIYTIHNLTENMAAFKSLKIGQSMLFLVRPDNYIGYIGAVDNLGKIQEYLKTISTETAVLS
ncbi:MAG: pentachlorophenol monooxygenase [Aureispira sp.]|nr:pentachlorophenol monooxygenase [Aureispira sp.]